LLESLREFEVENNIQICVVDMGSTEEGLVSYLSAQERSGFIEFCYFDPKLKKRDWINDEYIARNKLIEMSRYETLMFLQDDSQFIANKEVLSKAIDDLWEMEDCYCMEIYGVRMQTMRDTLDLTPITHNGTKYWRRKDRHFLTTGIYKKEVYNKIGEYPTEWEKIKENWGKSENWYDEQFKKTFPNGQVYRTHVPLMLSVWNDPRGGYAFIRENKRFGYYLDPVDENGLYYEKNVTTLDLDSPGPLGFMHIANPLGWEIATDGQGEQKKYSQWAIISGEGPEENLS
jgi:hypothetical protein